MRLTGAGEGTGAAWGAGHPEGPGDVAERVSRFPHGQAGGGDGQRARRASPQDGHGRRGAVTAA
jgi:hypothetical protein